MQDEHFKQYRSPYEGQIAGLIEGANNGMGFPEAVEKFSEYIDGQVGCAFYDRATNTIIDGLRAYGNSIVNPAVTLYRRGYEQVLGLHPAEKGSLDKPHEQIHKEFVEFFKEHFADFVHKVR